MLDKFFLLQLFKAFFPFFTENLTGLCFFVSLEVLREDLSGFKSLLIAHRREQLFHEFTRANPCSAQAGGGCATGYAPANRVFQRQFLT